MTPKKEDAPPPTVPKGTDLKKLMELRARGMSQEEIGKILGCTRQAVSHLLRKHGEHLEGIEVFKANRADLLAAKQAEILDAMSPEKIEKMSGRDLTVSFGVLFDKERLERGQSTENTAVSLLFGAMNQATGHALNGDKK